MWSGDDDCIANVRGLRHGGLGRTPVSVRELLFQYRGAVPLGLPPPETVREALAVANAVDRVGVYSLRSLSKFVSKTRRLVAFEYVAVAADDVPRGADALWTVALANLTRLRLEVGPSVRQNADAREELHFASGIGIFRTDRRSGDHLEKTRETSNVGVPQNKIFTRRRRRRR